MTSDVQEDEKMVEVLSLEQQEANDQTLHSLNEAEKSLAEEELNLQQEIEAEERKSIDLEAQEVQAKEEEVEQIEVDKVRAKSHLFLCLSYF